MPLSVYSSFGSKVVTSVRYFESGNDSSSDLMQTIPTGNPRPPQLRIQASVGGLNLPTITGRIVEPIFSGIECAYLCCHTFSYMVIFNNKISFMISINLLRHQPLILHIYTFQNPQKESRQPILLPHLFPFPSGF